ncbi:hypothetical protein [Senegalia massiliensis]|uniref:hypothetical protein n=1 Tax=Senegalia massiliensis TaxID=1720316 RepID=UPI0010303F30|nr:hypothetical protein [Senegalia massiliensis]
MKSKVIRRFYDKREKKIQPIGTIIDVSKERFEEINSTKYGQLVEEFEEIQDTEETIDNTDFPKHTGGGWYELSNGEKIQGKEEALKAENELM